MVKKPVLYYLDLSPPARAVMLTAAAIGLDLELKEVSLVNGEHLKEEFRKINPQHTIPTLDDNGFIIWDSHAICTYIVAKYGKDDKLYPKDLCLRAKVDQRLHFDTGVLFARLRNLFEPILYFKSPVVPEEKIEAIKKGYEFIEAFLKDSDYLVGNNITVADFCCVASISSSAGVAPHDKEKYPRMIEWINRLKKLPYYDDLNEKGAKILIKSYDETLAANRAAVK